MSKVQMFKGCPKEGCAMHDKKEKLDPDYRLCPQCGTELVYVCSKCSAELEEMSENGLCESCSLEADKKKEHFDKLKGAARKAGDIAVNEIGASLMKKTANRLESKAAKTLADSVETVAKGAVKTILKK